MIVTREDVSTMEKESAYFTEKEAMWIYVSWCLLDFIKLCENTPRDPLFSTEDVLSLIRQGKHKEAFAEATGGGTEIGTDYYLYLDTESPHFTVKEAQHHLDMILRKDFSV